MRFKIWPKKLKNQIDQPRSIQAHTVFKAKHGWAEKAITLMSCHSEKKYYFWKGLPLGHPPGVHLKSYRPGPWTKNAFLFFAF